MTVSSNAERHYAPGSSRERSSLATLAQQMAMVARGERLEQLRLARGISQEDLPHVLKEFNGGEKVMSRRAWQLWVAGNGIKKKNAEVVARFFEVPVDEVADPDIPEGMVLADPDQLDRIEEKMDEILERLKRDGGESEGPPPKASPPKLEPVPSPNRGTSRQAPSRRRAPRRKSN